MAAATAPSSSAQIPLATLAPALSREHLAQYAAANIDVRKVRRVAAVARFDGWTVAVLGAASLLLGLGSPAGIIMGLGMGGIAYIELRCASHLRRLDFRTYRTLALNQLAFAVLLIGYAASRVYLEYHGGGAFAELSRSNPDVAQLMGPWEDLSRSISTAVYSALIVFAIVAQGGMAWYYAARGRWVRAYVGRTPNWIIELQKSGLSI